MTRVDFHVLPAQPRRQHDVYVCQLVERAWRAGQRVHVHCLDRDMLEALDDLLWTFSDTSFLPHAAVDSDDAGAAPVTIGCGDRLPADAAVLVNLDVAVPTFFSQFERVIETTGSDEHEKAQARQRYRFYKDRGYPIETINA